MPTVDLTTHRQLALDELEIPQEDAAFARELDVHHQLAWPQSRALCVERGVNTRQSKCRGFAIGPAAPSVRKIRRFAEVAPHFRSRRLHVGSALRR